MGLTLDTKRPSNALNASVFVLITNASLGGGTADTSQKLSWGWMNCKYVHWGQNNTCLDRALWAKLVLEKRLLPSIEVM